MKSIVLLAISLFLLQPIRAQLSVQQLRTAGLLYTSDPSDEKYGGDAGDRLYM